MGDEERGAERGRKAHVQALRRTSDRLSAQLRNLRPCDATGCNEWLLTASGYALAANGDLRRWISECEIAVGIKKVDPTPQPSEGGA